MPGLRTDVSDLLARPGARVTRRERVGLVVPALSVSPVDDAVDLDLVLEHVTDGIVIHGSASGTWTGACSRCLAQVTGPFEVAVRELFEREPVEGETYPIVDDEIDLELPLRDAVVLELPAVPLCRGDCAGLCPMCGVDRNQTGCDCTVEAGDPRWAALDELHL